MILRLTRFHTHMNSTVEARCHTVDNNYTTCRQSIDRLQKLHGDLAVQQELASLVRDQVRTFAHAIQVLFASVCAAHYEQTLTLLAGFATTG